MDVIAVEKLTAAHCVVLLSSQELWRDCAFVLCLSSLASDSLPFVTGCAASHRGVRFGMSGVIQHERAEVRKNSNQRLSQLEVSPTSQENTLLMKAEPRLLTEMCLDPSQNLLQCRKYTI